MIKIVILSCFIIVLNTARAEPPREFAEHLFHSKDYADARLEYERLYFFSSDSIRRSFLKYRIGLCCMHTGDFDQAAEHFSCVQKNSDWGDSARLQSAECALADGRAAAAESCATGISLEKGPLIQGYAAFLQEEYPKARQLLLAMPESSPYALKARRIAALTDSINTVKPKHYLPAGILSLAPGMGHLYTKRYGDALFSFTVIGAFSGMAAYYYHAEAVTRGRAAAALGGIFYCSSIYGALVSVKLYNKELREKHRRNAKHFFEEQ